MNEAAGYNEASALRERCNRSVSSRVSSVSVGVSIRRKGDYSVPSILKQRSPIGLKPIQQPLFTVGKMPV